MPVSHFAIQIRIVLIKKYALGLQKDVKNIAQLKMSVKWMKYVRDGQPIDGNRQGPK